MDSSAASARGDDCECGSVQTLYGAEACTYAWTHLRKVDAFSFGPDTPPEEREEAYVCPSTGVAFMMDRDPDRGSKSLPMWRLRSLLSMPPLSKPRSAQCHCQELSVLWDEEVEQYATHHLREVYSLTWQGVYVCPHTGIGFLYTYAHGELQGGGWPWLRPFDAFTRPDEACSWQLFDYPGAWFFQFWLGHQPRPIHRPVDCTTADQPASPTEAAGSRYEVAMEWERPPSRYGPMVYAYLGLTYTHQEGADLSVSVVRDVPFPPPHYFLLGRLHSVAWRLIDFPPSAEDVVRQAVLNDPHAKELCGHVEIHVGPYREEPTTELALTLAAGMLMVLVTKRAERLTQAQLRDIIDKKET